MVLICGVMKRSQQSGSERFSFSPEKTQTAWMNPENRVLSSSADDLPSNEALNVRLQIHGGKVATRLEHTAELRAVILMYV